MKKLLGLCALALACGCANRSAGVLVARAQSEFATYQTNANTKVQSAEDARLELELHLVRIDVENLFKSGALPPAEAAKRTIEQVMLKVNSYRERLAVWRGTDNSANMIRLELAAVAKYHSTGVSAEDLIPAVDAFGEAAPTFIPKRIEVPADAPPI